MNTEGYVPLTEGAFGAIFYNKETQQIKKIQNLWLDDDNDNDEPRINSTAISELIYLHYVKNIVGCPRISNVKIDLKKEVIEIKMPYYGIPLTDWLLDQSVTEQDFLWMIVQLSKTLSEMMMADIQHTDLKPANVIITPEKTPVIIDFNLCSVRNNYNTRYGWSYAIGTWVYMPLEIVFHQQPSNSTMSWFIGLLIAIFYTKQHPIEFFFKDASTIYKKREWIKVITALKKKAPLVFPIRLDMVRKIDSRVLNIYYQCMRWEPNQRIKLNELYYSLLNCYNTKFNLALPIPMPNINPDIIFTTKTPINKRNDDLKILYNLCKHNRYRSLLARAICLYDLYPDDHNNMTLCACVCLSCLIITDLIFNEEPILIAIKAQLKLSNENIDKSILDFGNKINWNIYTSCSKVITKDYDLLYESMRKIQGSYTLADIALYCQTILKDSICENSNGEDSKRDIKTSPKSI